MTQIHHTVVIPVQDIDPWLWSDPEGAVIDSFERTGKDGFTGRIRRKQDLMCVSVDVDTDEAFVGCGGQQEIVIIHDNLVYFSKKKEKAGIVEQMEIGSLTRLLVDPHHG